MSHDAALDETRRLDLAAWRGLWRLVRKERRALVLLVAAACATAAVDASFPVVTARLIDAIARDGREVALAPYAGAYLFLAVSLALLVRAFLRLGGHVRAAVAFEVRQAGFESLQRLSFAYFDRRPVGWLMARMTSDCDRLAQVFAWGVLDVVWDLALMAAIALVLLWVNAKLALAVFVVVPLLAFASFRFQRTIFASARRVRRANSKLTAAYNEGLGGVRTAKVLRRERADTEDFSLLADDMRLHSVANQVHAALFLPVVLSLGSLATGTALVLGGLDVLAGMQIGTLILFMSHSARFFEPLQELAHWFAELQMAQASAERVLGLIGEEPTVRDTPAALAATTPVGRRLERIAFRDVSFGYGPGRPVIEGFSLDVRAGETIALVGPTGGGKSTLVSLLARFYEPTAGAVLFDGVDYRERSLAWLRGRLGVVQQTPHLFSGTVAENLRFGRPDATDEELEAACRRVGAHDLVCALEDGYATRVGEGGNRLSTGEKQLVSLARVLLCDPEVLVLDEATSSVDAATEARLQAGLEEVLAGRTAFVIAHRLSTVRAASRILVIEGGRAVEVGTHAELLARRGRYHGLATRFAEDLPWGAPAPGIA